MIMQGFQLSRIERESPAWTLFLPLSPKHVKCPTSMKKCRQACKISRISGEKPLENNYLANFHRLGGMQLKKKKKNYRAHTYQFRF